MFVVVDDYSRKSWVMLLKNKADAGDRLKEWKALVENKRGLKLGKLRTNNGGKFTSAALRTWLEEKGVSLSLTHFPTYLHTRTPHLRVIGAYGGQSKYVVTEQYILHRRKEDDTRT